MKQRSVLRLAIILAVGILIAACISCNIDNPFEPENTSGYITIRIRDYEFAEGRIFDLFRRLEDISPNDRIVELRVFRGRPELRPEDAIQFQVATLYIHPDSTVNDPYQETYRVEELDRSVYSIFEDGMGNKHCVVFSSRQDAPLGVWMKVERRFWDSSIHDTIAVGDMLSDTLELKMLQPHVGRTPSHPTWPLMWRNVYSTPRGMTAGELEIKIFKAPPGREGSTSALEDQQVSSTSQGRYVAILGLDQFNDEGVKKQDYKVDDRPDILRPDWGLLIFPSREPFASDTTFRDVDGRETAMLVATVPVIYHSSNIAEKAASSEYYIEYRDRIPY